MTREAAVQRWPVVPKADHRIPSVARSRSASARTTTPFLPPSSSDTRLSRRPARSAMCLPVTDEPVNEMTDTSGLSTIASPTSAPEPVTRLTVPGGKPASAISSTRSVAQWGVSDDGLNTTVLPVTSAGIVFQHGIAIGKFQGVMIPATPIGWRMLIAHLSGQLGRDRVAEHPATLAGHQEGDVDALLDVAAGLREDLAHLPGHRPGEPLLVLGHQRPEAVQDLAALGGRRAAPERAGRLGRPDGHARRPPALPAWNRPMTSRVSAGLRLSKVAPGRRSRPTPRR